MSDPSTDKPSRAARARMTGRERREQLIGIGRKHFADKGFEGATVEEIAASAGVSKPVVYEHFGGKEGLYAVVVDREIESLLAAVQGALTSGGTLARDHRAGGPGAARLRRDARPTASGSSCATAPPARPPGPSPA